VYGLPKIPLFFNDSPAVPATPYTKNPPKKPTWRVGWQVVFHGASVTASLVRLLQQLDAGQSSPIKAVQGLTFRKLKPPIVIGARELALHFADLPQARSRP
jgi:hypothetical protein